MTNLEINATPTTEQAMQEVPERALQGLAKAGADAAGARMARSRHVSLTWRDGNLEKIEEATSKGLTTRVFSQGRYSSGSTSDLRATALEAFVERSVAMTGLLAKDPHRRLPGEALYEGRPLDDLQLYDASYETLSATERRALVAEVGEAARSVPGAENIISVSAGCYDERGDVVQRHSDGFQGSKTSTVFGVHASVTIRGEEGKRPMGWASSASRKRASLENPKAVGRRAAERALAQIGSGPIPTARVTMIVENRVGSRLIGDLMGALSGSSLQQKRSFLEGRFGQTIASKLLSITDNPLVPGGFASRAFDGEGIAARRRPIIHEGRLEDAYYDTYYASKLGVAPTSGSRSNLIFAGGDRDLRGLITDVSDGILVTGFLGGNSNPTTGAFSLGVQGFLLKAGQRVQPISEVNASGSYLELFKQLVALGNDPYMASSTRVPTLVFEGVQLSGR